MVDRDDTRFENNPPELKALTEVVQALRPLSPELRKRVMDSALVLLGGVPSARSSAPEPLTERASIAGVSPATASTDIRQLKEAKNPASANEMAALIAYYLDEVASAEEHRDAVGIADVKKYFKQAQFRLPSNPAMILVNAKNAGYFDSVGGGKYRLNPVGYNLIVHSLPRAASSGGRTSKRRAVGKRRPSLKREK